jgi:hypothetical protein
MPAGARDFSLLQNVQPSSGAHSASYSVGSGVLSWRVKWQGHEVNHSHPPSAKVRNEWRYTSTPHVCLHDMGQRILTLTVCQMFYYDAI